MIHRFRIDRVCLDEIAKKQSSVLLDSPGSAHFAHSAKELKIIDDNIKVLGNIREGWILLKKQQKGDQPLEI